MADDLRLFQGTNLPLDWLPVVVGTELDVRTVALRVGTGGGNLSAELMSSGGVAREFKNVANGEVIEGAFTKVTAVTGTVADIQAAIAHPRIS